MSNLLKEMEEKNVYEKSGQLPSSLNLRQKDVFSGQTAGSGTADGTQFPT